MPCTVYDCIQITITMDFYMKNGLLVTMVFVFSVIIGSELYVEGAWERVTDTVLDSGARSVVLYSGNRMVAGTERSVYIVEEGAGLARISLRVPGELATVHDVAVDPDNAQNIYAATAAGLYGSSDGGDRWERLYSPSEADQRRCFAVAVVDGRIFLGTARGLRIRESGSIRWQKGFAELHNVPVTDIVPGKINGRLYFMTDRAVYRYGESEGLRKIFTAGMRKLGHAVSLDKEPFLDDFSMRALAVADEPIGHLLIAATRGLFFSQDDGDVWTSMGASQVIPGDITALLFVPGALHLKAPSFMVASRRGVVHYHQGQWRSLYQGLPTSRINDLEGVPGEGVIAATDQGLYRLDLDLDVSDDAAPKDINLQTIEEDYLSLVQHFIAEPTVNDVHQMVISYAEVDNKKIRNWRRQAGRRAWLPRVSIGFDADRDRSVSDSIWGSYSGGGQHYIGVDDKTSGQGAGWDIGMSWDLADLVWSTDQTTIDSRAKMMVELREDVLDQATRLYFERRRLQMDLAGEYNVYALVERLDKQMRVAELTALIDALTGGGFSERLNTDNKERMQ